MIKEFKLNFDAKHLPCLSFVSKRDLFFICLNSTKPYSLDGLTRWMALFVGWPYSLDGLIDKIYNSK